MEQGLKLNPGSIKCHANYLKQFASLRKIIVFGGLFQLGKGVGKPPRAQVRATALQLVSQATCGLCIVFTNRLVELINLIVGLLEKQSNNFPQGIILSIAAELVEVGFIEQE